MLETVEKFARGQAPSHHVACLAHAREVAMLRLAPHDVVLLRSDALHANHVEVRDRHDVHLAVVGQEGERVRAQTLLDKRRAARREPLQRG